MQSEGKSRLFYVHVLIFFLLTFSGGLLPSMGLPPMGIKIIGVFLGLLYGWSTLGFAWPSMISMIALGFSGYANPDQVIISAFSHPAVLLAFFVLAFTEYCSQSGLNETLAKWLLSRKVFIGRPWVFTTSVLLSVLILSFLLDALPAVFLVSSILYTLFKDVDYKQGDAYPAFLLAGVFIAGVTSFACKPWAGQNLLAIGALENISNGTIIINNLSIISIVFPVCVAILLVYVLFMRFIFRPDMTPLSRLSEEYLSNLSKEIKIDKKQIVAIISLIIFLLLMFLPSIVSKESSFGILISKLTMVPAIVVILGVLSFIKVDGKIVFDFQKCSQAINWNIIWMLAASIPISSAMSSEQAGITNILTSVVNNWASGGNVILFLAGFMIFSTVMTQFTHNVTIVLIAVPIIWNVSQSAGINPVAFTILMMIAAGIAYATPAASTVGALSFANGEWIGTKRAFQAGILGTIGGIICMLLLGLPLAAIIIGL